MLDSGLKHDYLFDIGDTDRVIDLGDQNTPDLCTSWKVGTP